IDRVEFLEQFTRRVAQDVGCSRAAVRMLIHAPEGAALRCLSIFDTVSGQPSKAPDMVADDSSASFEELLHHGYVMAADCRHESATAPFAARYFEPLGVLSLLDVAFSVNGILYGTFSCEQVGSMQAWTPAQLHLLRQIASRASLTLMHAITSQIDTTP